MAALASPNLRRGLAKQTSMRTVSAPEGGRAARVTIFDEAVEDLLATLKHDEDAPRIGIHLTPSEVLALRHLLKPQIDALMDQRAPQDHFGHINLMAADEGMVAPSPAQLAKTKTTSSHHHRTGGRRSSFTADASRRRRRRVNTFIRFDGLEELNRQKTRVTTDLDSSAVQGVFALFEDHNLWHKRLHGVQFFREAVRKVIRINRANKHAATILHRGDGVGGGGGSGGSDSTNAGSARASSSTDDLCSAAAQLELGIRANLSLEKPKYKLRFPKRKGFSHRVSKSFQKDMVKFQQNNVLWNPSPEVLAALVAVNQWGAFDIWNLFRHVPGSQIGHVLGSKARGTVKVLAIEMLEKRTRLLSHMHVSPPGVVKFLDRVCDAYLDNPYHNALHGVDVMQGLHAMLVSSGITHAFESDGVTRSDVDRAVSGHALSRKNHFGALLAALCHDIGHSGFTNRFLVRTSDPIATQYNDQSVLENMHVATALKLARECMIFSSFTNDERRTVRHLMIEMILETDMAKHIVSLWKLEHDLEAARRTAFMESEQSAANGDGGGEGGGGGGEGGGGKGDSSSRSNRGSAQSPTQHHYDGFSMKNYVNTLSLMLHACDLSNPTKPWKTYRTWTDRVMEEFFAQSAKEAELKIPLTLPLKETCSLDQFQIGFIRFIKPFFAALGQVPALDLSEQMENLEANEKQWMELRVSGISLLGSGGSSGGGGVVEPKWFQKGPV